MKNSLCRKLAFVNIRKNRRFFIPRILTETGLLACFYIIFTLACDGRLSDVKGGSYLPTFMQMGAVIIGLLSFILILYTNSFLMKQRKHEFGLYNVLGMEKKHICRIMLHESLICTAISIVTGILCGILFYKLCSVAICKLLKAEIVAGFYFITPMTVLPSGAVFFGIDILSFIVNCIGIVKMKPVELISGNNVGEKEPKSKVVLFILGLLTLGGGYLISLTTDNPLKAIPLFFAAVLLVIAGTYLMFTAGSIFILKKLKKNEKFYYKPNNITAVSGLLYRMKQNAVGLASVAVLATGVLVMISSTFCLYIRTEKVLNQNYPQDYYLPTVFYGNDGKPAEFPENIIEGIIHSSANRYGLKVRDVFRQDYLEVPFLRQSGVLTADREAVSDETNIESICDIVFITENMYVDLGGKPLGLQENEVAVCPFSINDAFDDKYFTMCGMDFTVRQTLTVFPVNAYMTSVNRCGMVVADENVITKIYEAQKNSYAELAPEMQSRYCVSFDNRNRTLEVGNDFSADVVKSIDSYIVSAGHSSYSIGSFDSFWEAHESLYGMYGTLLFLGILLGTVCMFATVLIIYYKQISEGYEDRSRHQIMRKIGLTDGEVKKTIRSQIMLVFFLPLITAGIHTAFAYPILTRLMELLLLDNVMFFAKLCVAVYAVFALVYAVIYGLTAKTYYKIVH